jgi:hypothetical protein
MPATTGMLVNVTFGRYSSIKMKFDWLRRHCERSEAIQSREERAGLLRRWRSSQ